MELATKQPLSHEIIASRISQSSRLQFLSRGGTLPIMPTLTRFIVILFMGAALVFGAMLALVTFVDPAPREIAVQVPASHLLKDPPAR